MTTGWRGGRSFGTALVLAVALVTSGCVTSGTGGTRPREPFEPSSPPSAASPAISLPTQPPGGPGPTFDPGRTLAPGQTLGPDGPGPGGSGDPGTPPDTTNIGPPEWVHTGTRISYYSAAASVVQANFTFIEDPDGAWTDAATGQRYRRTDETGEAIPSASGDGISQIDVLAVDGPNVVLSNTLYPIDRANNLFSVVPGAGASVPGTIVDGAWIHPDRLREFETARIGGLLILRGPYVINDQTFQAISFSTGANGVSSSYTYDTQTGLLLSARTSTAGASSPVTVIGQPPQPGNTQLTITRFAGLRQRSLPGLGGINPEWVARTGQLHYVGTYNFTNPVDPSSANLTYPAQIDVAFGQGGTDWAPYASRTFVQMPGGQPSDASGVTGTAGLYWIDPRGLVGLSAGQTLDQDPVTGEQLVVASIDQGPGGPIVTFRSQIPGVLNRTSYDTTTGVLLGYFAQLAGSGSTYQLQLAQMP